MPTLNPPEDQQTQTDNPWDIINNVSPENQKAMADSQEASALQRHAGAYDTWAGSAIDVGRGLANAPFHLAGNLADLGNDVLGSPLGEIPEINMLGKTETVSGSLAQGVTEFAIDFAATAGILKTAGIASKIKALKYGKALLPITEGAVADFTAFREHDSRLSDLAWELGDKHPSLRNFITEALHGTGDENWFEGRIKNVVEGGILGGATGLFIKAIKGLRASRAALASGGEKAASEVITKTAQELEPEIEAFMRGEKDFSGGISEDTAKAVLMKVGSVNADEASKVLLSMQSMSKNLGTDFSSLLKDKLTSLRSRSFAKFTEADVKTADKDKPLLDRVAKGMLNYPAATMDSPGFTESLQKFLSPNDPQLIQVNSVDQLKDLFRVAGVAEENISSSINSAVKKSGVESLDKSIENGLSVSAHDLSTPTEAMNYGLWRRMQAGQLRATDAVQDYAKLTATSPYGPLTQNRLWQSMETSPAAAKGVTDFMEQGKAVVTLFESADASTFVHEMGHIIRRNLPESELKKAAEALGVGDFRNWTRAEEETFANSLSDKVFKGISASPALDSVLGKTEKVMAGVYRDLRNSSFGAKVSSKVQDFYETKNGVAKADMPLLTTNDTKELAAAGKVIADAMAKGEDFSRILDDNGINLFHVSTSDDLLKLTGSVSKFVEENVAPHLKDVESRAAVMKQAELQAKELGVSTDAFVARQAEIAGHTKDLSTMVAEARITIHTVVSDFDRVAKAAGENRTLENASKFLQSWDQVKSAMAYYRETQQSIGRSLGIFNSKAGPIDRIAQLEQMIKQGGSDKVWGLVEEVNRINALTPSADRTLAKHRLMQQNKFWGVVNEFRINSMLGSGPGLGADIVSNAFKTLTMPFEKALAAGFSLDMAGVREALSTYKALGTQLFDSFRTASAAFKLGDTILDNTIENGHEAFIKGSTFNQAGTGLGRAIDLMGTVVRLPSRLRMTGDELFKQLNYRAVMESRFTREAMEKGIGDINGYVRDSLSKVFDDVGRGIDSEALAYARQATFSTPLVEGISGKLMQMAAAHPWIRLFVPFIKTPLNIFFDTVGHTPMVGLLLKDQRAALRDLSSPEAKMVLAKWSLGGSLLGGALYLHQGGAITGRGSMDPKTQEQMKLSGWQPYSVVYTDDNGKKQYIGFNRIEPWGSLMGLVADYMDLAPNMKEADVSKVSTAMLAAVSRNVTNKTYLKGISDFMNAMSQPDQNLGKYLASMAGSFVPRSLSIFANDPYVREAQGVMDGIRAKLPGYSETLPPKRNLLGEPIPVNQAAILPDSISPFAFSESIKDPVKVELASLGNGFKHPDPKQYGVDYRTYSNAKGQTAYDRMLELVGQTQVGGQRITKTLNDLIATKDYQKLVKAGEAGLPFRIKSVGQVLAKYHVAAEEQMLKEFPKLRAEVQTGRIKQSSDLFTQIQNIQQGKE